MPTVAYFYGIAVSMYYNDHAPPHFHAAYGGFRALIRIEDGQVMAGRLPPNAIRLVVDFAKVRQEELRANWSKGEKDEPLERIAGPDEPERR